MKFRFILLNVLLIYFLMAAPVDLNKAQRVAGNIYAERSNTGAMDGFNLRSVDVIDDNAINLGDGIPWASILWTIPLYSSFS